ncbi:uncharacterized protein K02A2.6-like [Lucilia cuprina]|uniref:uncharacterized protein K02A2.6-like n=1 Tax=Lucilia cuprina TaxID=7375 RepID=UPI001F069F66|nr:uncharacterized protein K02A2.6-like [Lucilia cuprina]
MATAQSQNENFSLSPKMASFNTKATNVAVEWKKWSKQFNIYLLASNLDTQPDKRKVALLLHLMGPDTLEIFNSFNIGIDDIKYADLLKKFESHFIPQINIAMERHKFFTRRQGIEETISQYAITLENLSSSCAFGSLRESLLKDIFTCGLSESYKNIKERLLSEGNISWSKALEIAKSIEMAKENLASIHRKDEPIIALLHHNKMQKYQQQKCQSTKKQQQQNFKQNGVCKKCGQWHRSKCPAEGVLCNACGKPNHYAKMCYSRKNEKRVKPNNNKYVRNVCEDDLPEEDSLFIGSLTENGKSNIWNISVNVSGHDIICQVDTGAQTNLMSLNTFKSLGINKVDKNVVTNIVTFSGEKLPVFGKIFLTFYYENLGYSTYFYVLNMKCNNVIGLELAKEMNLIKSVNTIDSEKILNNFSEMFQGLGKLKEKCHLKVKENCQPVVDPPRRVPFSLHQPLKIELERMVKIEVIKEVKEPTDWVNSIVLVTKSNGTLRICLDPRNLNKVIVRPRFDFPTIDECKSRMCGSKVFSLLDAHSGFWMIELDDESSRLCTFNTPFGRFRFLRLPFGISSAPEIFHGEMVRLFGNIEGLVIYMDDFLIHAPSVETHNVILNKVLERARNVGLRFNRMKSKILKTEIKFIGHIFDSNGVRPDDKRVESILSMPVPQNKQELQRFLGMITYLSPFIDNLSFKNKHLRDLLKDNVIWSWNREQQVEFEDLKKVITKAPVLAYYDTMKPLTLSVDASKFAVGAVIMHGQNPIASASLTNSQINYAQIEKELFAIVFGCTRFHQYIYGKNVVVETDHKPLVPLFTKPLYSIPTRLQRFMLRLLSYNITVIYKPGKDLFIADTLSRAPLKEEVLEDLDKDIDLQCNSLFTQNSLSSREIENIRKEFEKDKVLQKVLKYIKNGWPLKKKALDSDLRPFYSIKDEIFEVEGILFKNKRILIPKSLRSKMLQNIHEGHIGIQGCQQIARGSIYWPNINNDIYNVVSSCDTCLKYRNANPKEELKSHEIVAIPWYKVGCDIFQFENKMYLVVVDYYSKYFEVEFLNSGYTATQVITKCKSIFSRQGIPAILVSDNGPPFSSSCFKTFCNDWGIEFVTSSPYLARSNGLAERTIQTVKNILYKCQYSGSDPYIAFLQYRTTPKNNLPSPSEILMSRKLRTKMPTHSDDLKPKILDSKNLEKHLRKREDKSSKYYNKGSVDLKPVEIGEKIYFKKNLDSLWFPGKIIAKCKEPRSFLIRDENGINYRRNRQHILKITTKKPNNFVTDSYKQKNNSDESYIYHYTQNSNNENVNNTNDNENVSISNNENIQINDNENLETNIRSNQNEIYTSKFGRKVVPPLRLNL